jgi:hypothetical protein
MQSFTFFLVALLIVVRDVGAISWPAFLDPEKGSTIQGEMQCYSLPYGGLGFASHILTYYTVGLIWAGKRPLKPWKDLDWAKWDVMLGIVTLIFSIGIATFTIIRCRNRWQFMLIAIWKIFMSAMLGFSTITAGLAVRRHQKDKTDRAAHPDRVPFIQQSGIEMTNRNTGRDTTSDGVRKKEKPSNPSAWWVLLYLPGLITGLVGLFSLVKENWDNSTIRLITYVMWGVPGGVCVLFACFVCAVVDSKDRTLGGSFTLIGSVVAGVGIVGAWYNDWILAAIAENYSGLPSSDNAVLYWGYFIAKKIPLGSL